MEKSIDLFSYIEEQLSLKNQEPETLSPLVLAYIGDSIQDLLMRMVVVSNGNRPVKKIHQDTISYVSAGAQSFMMRRIQEELTDTERTIYKRGRNAKSLSPAKNQSITDYRRATGFETLMGYLFLKKDYGRMVDLIKIGMNALEEEKEGEK